MREEEGEMEKKRKKKKENESRYVYMNKPGNCVRISCKMASLLQGLDAIMFIQRAYIMLNDRICVRVAVYTRIIAVCISQKRLTNPRNVRGKRETRRSA
jgi:hypothetical protein